jgi:hypothetical protein
MRDALAGLSLVDVSGYVIISVIIGLLIAGVMVTLYLRARYARIERDLERNGRAGSAFDSPVLNRIVTHAEEALSRHGGEINTQAIIDQSFQSELKGLLIGERFVKASTGLMIILGLVGTFYGLTLSIGKLVTLVSGDISDTSDIADALTQGLTRALSGMSVAFSTSLFGILAAIVMTVLGVFANVADRRTAVMVRIEAFVDNVLLRARRAAGAQPAMGRTDEMTGVTATAELARLCEGFGRSVEQLQGVVGQFEAALLSFSATTRDFREFNLHLKDNVQRMSLSFGDLSETLKDHVRELGARGQKQ